MAPRSRQGTSEQIWFRDAEVAEAVAVILFVGLLPECDLGIAVGSAAKTAALHSIDCRCQTRDAVAARKLGIIRADHAVALSLSVTHKAIGFDRRMPDVDFDTLDYPSTETLPVASDRGERHEGARHRQQPRLPINATGSTETT